MAKTKAPAGLGLDHRRVMIKLVGGRCSCEGECGHNHGWALDQAVLRCKAPHGQIIQRKIDNPSYWVLADNERIRLEYREEFRPNKIQVDLDILPKDGNPQNFEVTNWLVLCQRCKILIERKQADRAAVEPAR